MKQLFFVEEEMLQIDIPVHTWHTQINGECLTIKENLFKIQQAAKSYYITPESAFALNYFINNALCKMEIFLFSESAVF